MFYINYNVTDCENSVVTTPVANNQYIDYVNGLTTPYPINNVRHYSLEYSINCCTPEVVLLPVRYQFEVDSSDCFYNETGDYIDVYLEVLGINNTFVTQTQVSYDGINYSTISRVNIPNGFRIIPRISGVNSFTFPALAPVYVRITHADGFVYILEVYVTIPETFCPVDVAIVNRTWPSLPSNVVITNLANDELSLNSLFNKEVLEAGVYNIIICEVRNTSSNCLQRSYFTECTIKCDVVNKLVQCRNSDIFNYYDALNYSNNCENITYEDKCALYELMYMKLSNEACIDPYEDCNCNDNTTAPLFQNRIKPNNNRVGTKDCGCG